MIWQIKIMWVGGRERKKTMSPKGSSVIISVCGRKSTWMWAESLEMFPTATWTWNPCVMRPLQPKNLAYPAPFSRQHYAEHRNRSFHWNTSRVCPFSPLTHAHLLTLILHHPGLWHLLAQVFPSWGNWKQTGLGVGCSFASCTSFCLVNLHFWRHETRTIQVPQPCIGIVTVLSLIVSELVSERSQFRWFTSLN